MKFEGQKRILHVIDSFGVGGAETWLLATVKYLYEHPELNTRFDFLLSGGEPRVLDAEVKKYGSKLFYIKYSFGHFLRFRKEFRALLKANNYDAIHDHQDFVSGWHFLLGSGLLPKSRISHLHNPYNFVHNYVVNPVRWFSFKVGRKLMVKFTGKITATSDEVMDEYGYDKPPFTTKRVRPAYCGFDVRKFLYEYGAKEQLCNELGWDKQIKIGLFVGRIGLQVYDTAQNQKNPEFAFLVASELVTKHPNWNFLFVGFKGRKGEELQERAKKLGLERRIFFTGLRSDVAQIMSASDTMIFPSLWEGLGMVAVEAQANGLPCVISDAVPKEAIVCKDLVAIRKLEDGPSAWVDTIVEMAKANPVERRMYEAQLENSPYSIQRSVDYLLSLYGS